jgi:hypothetical protein
MKLFAVAIVALLASSGKCFAPVATGQGSRTTRLYSVTEKELRKELNKRNSKVENEGQYTIPDGANVEAVLKDMTPSPTTAEDPSSLQAKLERLVQPRAYPLFLAEKAAEILESTIQGITGKGEAVNGKEKERIVILGTGWGAAAFLKGIDTNLYQVTVISPRNFFLFTPMLAGASVGSVEYRSITEPIREVRVAFVCYCGLGRLFT